MAELNVRDRTIEATIAYVGTHLAGRATNLDHLSREPRMEKVELGDERRALSFRPASATSFRDCRVKVRIVAPPGGISSEESRAVLRSADGVVVIVDADRESIAQHRNTADAVRRALEVPAPRSVPVIVQVNKIDLEHAAGVDEVLEAMAATPWTGIAACALRGEGVVETLERAVASAIEALGQGEQGVSSTPDRATDGRPAKNPLLGALEQVLRETASRHLEEIDALRAGSMELELAGAIERVLEADRASTASLLAALARLDARTSTIEQRMSELCEESKRRRRGWFS